MVFYKNKQSVEGGLIQKIDGVICLDLLLFDLSIAAMLIVCISRYKSVITPFSVIASVYTLLINLNNLVFTHIYGYYPVNTNALLVLLLFFAVIFLVDLTGAAALEKLTFSKQASLAVPANEMIIALLFAFGFLSYLVQFILVSMEYGIDGAKGNNNGILGHWSMFAFMILPIFLEVAFQSKDRKKILGALVLAAGTFLLSVLFGGKYVIMINVMYLAIYFLLKHPENINIKKIFTIGVVVLCVVLVVFLVLYCVVPLISGAYGESATFGGAAVFAMKQIFDYLIGPIVANNYTIEHAGEWNSLVPFTVPYNIFERFLGNREYVNPIITNLMQISSDATTNVSGILGELVYCLGLFGGLAYAAVGFALTNTIYVIFRKCNLYLMTTGYLLAMIFMCFFCNFFTVAGAFLPLAYLFITETVLHGVQFFREKRRK